MSKHIVIIDDDPDLLDAIALSLEYRSYRVMVSLFGKLPQLASLCEAEAYLPKPFRHINDVGDTVARLLAAEKIAQ